MAILERGSLWENVGLQPPSWVALKSRPEEGTGKYKSMLLLVSPESKEKPTWVSRVVL
jgi:hypothetical protein